MFTLLTGLKAKLVAFGLGALALLAFIAYVFGLGKKQAEAESLKKGEIEEDALQDSINAGHNAGNAVAHGGGVQPESDPRNRANRRGGKS